MLCPRCHILMLLEDVLEWEEENEKFEGWCCPTCRYFESRIATLKE